MTSRCSVLYCCGVRRLISTRGAGSVDVPASCSTSSTGARSRGWGSRSGTSHPGGTEVSRMPYGEAITSSHVRRALASNDSAITASSTSISRQRPGVAPPAAVLRQAEPFGQLGDDPPLRSAFADGFDDGRHPAQERIGLQVAPQHVAALEVVGHRQDVGGQRGGLARAGLDRDEHIELAERLAQCRLPGDRQRRVADAHDQGAHLPGADLVGQRSAGHLAVDQPGQVGPARRTRPEIAATARHTVLDPPQ